MTDKTSVVSTLIDVTIYVGILSGIVAVVVSTCTWLGC